MTARLHGLRQCDTMRKAMRWLDEHGVDWVFCDYRRQPPDELRLRLWIRAAGGWERLINRRGLTWRRLDETERGNLDEARAVKLMQAHPSLIRRPVLELEDGRVEVGFSPERYAAIFGA